MSHISHVFLAGSLLLSQMDQNVSAQTIPAGSPGDKATITSFSTQSRVQDVITPKNIATSPEISDNKYVIKDTSSLYGNEKAYNAAVIEAQNELAGIASLQVNNSGARMGLWNDTAGKALLIITSKFTTEDRAGKGKWEAWIGENRSVFVGIKMSFY